MVALRPDQAIATTSALLFARALVAKGALGRRKLKSAAELHRSYQRVEVRRTKDFPGAERTEPAHAGSHGVSAIHR